MYYKILRSEFVLKKKIKFYFAAWLVAQVAVVVVGACKTVKESNLLTSNVNQSVKVGLPQSFSLLDQQHELPSQLLERCQDSLRYFYLAPGSL